MSAFEIVKPSEHVVNIKVIGVGGGGGNVVNRLMEAGVTSAEMVAINTDKQALARIQATHKIPIGEKITKGMGAGANPEVGKKAMSECAQEVQNLLEETDMVFVAAGMGGGTGTGAAPLVAQIAHELGILTIGIVTKPFHFEGTRRMRQAESGIEELRQHVDSLIIIPNERLKEINKDERISLVRGFEIADSVLKEAVQSISDLINSNQTVNLDFADLSSVMRGAGFAHIGVGQGQGKDKATVAAKAAICSPLLETSINGAKGAVVLVVGGMDLGLDEVDDAVSMVKGAVYHDANIIFGATMTEVLKDEVRIIVIATGLDSNAENENDAVSSGKPFFTNSNIIPANEKSEPAEPAGFTPSESAPPPVKDEPFESIFKIFRKD